MLHVPISDISLYKIVKYWFLWSFLEFGEENKMCWKLNLQGVIIFSLNQTQRGAIYKAFTSYHQRFWKWGKWEISFKSKIIILYKSIKYSYFWSFSGYEEENKMFWKLNFTAHMMIFHQLEPSVGWNYQMTGNSLFSLF